MGKTADRIKQSIIEGAIETSGEVISAGIGVAVAGPPGAIGGAAIGALVSHVGNELLRGILSKKETERVDQVIDSIKNTIKDNENAGKIIREDGFFLNDIDRSSAEEICEGILISAQKEYEEKKINLLGRLYANIAYDKQVTREIANALIKQANSLTYQELKVIKYL